MQSHERFHSNARGMNSIVITALDSAFRVMDTCRNGVPFTAIRYVREQPTAPEIVDRIAFALTHAYDEAYHDAKEDYWYAAPLWYAIAAETHLDLALIAPTIALFASEVDDDWDFLNEQGMILLEFLAQRYRGATLDGVRRAIRQHIRKRTHGPCIFLYDVLSYSDTSVRPERRWLLRMMRKRHLPYPDAFAHGLAVLGLGEAIPIIERRKRKAEGTHEAIEYEECLEWFADGIPSDRRPHCETRGDWESHYRALEHRFLDGPGIAGDHIGRNDPCPCGAVKTDGHPIKYKHCHGE